MSEARPLGVLLVGPGLIGRFHAQAVAASEKLHLVAVCGRNAEKTAAFASEFGADAVCDLDAALARPDVDMVLVATPSGAHDGAVFAAAAHRKPVLVEKPITLTAARARAMIAACRKTNTPLGCIFQMRWTEDFLKAKAAVESGELGRITYAAVRVPWWRTDEYYSKTPWHGTWEMDGGGALINQAVHLVDQLVALMPPVVGVKAFCGTLAHNIETEDTVSAALRFEGGALGSVYATTASFPGRGKALELTGTKGTCCVEDGAHGVNRPDAIQFDPHRKCFEAFADSLTGGAPYPIPGEEALKSVALIERIYHDAGIR